MEKANIALDKENKRTKLAFNESQREKCDILKELNIQRESLAEALKENAVLNEEVHIKAEFIKVLTKEHEQLKDKEGEVSEQNKDIDDNIRTNSDYEATTDELEEGEISDQNKDTDDSIRTNSNSEPIPNVAKCDKCNYRSKVKSDLKGHMLVHSEQYQCQQGCKKYFKTLAQLDTHHNSIHSQKQRMNTHKCDKCDSIFKEAHQLRIHKKLKHYERNEFKCEKCNFTSRDIYFIRKHKEEGHGMTNISCDLCGEIFARKNDFEKHRNSCNQGYQKIMNKECFYFKKGRCLKRENCAFKHETKKSEIPECRNGISCKYLRNGICLFVHKDSRVQNNELWCKFSENCRRFSNCPYLHSEQDFPNLPKITKPPFWHQNVAQAWKEC